MLTVKDVAARLGVSIQTVYVLAARKMLTVYRIGANGRGALRFKPEDVDRFLESCRVNQLFPPHARGNR